MNKFQYKYFLCKLNGKVVVKFQVFWGQIEEVKGHREIVVLEVNEVKCVNSDEGYHDLQHKQDHEIQQLCNYPLPNRRYHKDIDFRTLVSNIN